MRDEAEIKGHRRTYIGAMPGKIIQGLKIVKTKNPVYMIDEIDKLGASYQGDPSSALLEVLDPEQNISFRDYYLDLPFDISHILFITTANTLDSIPGPLLDRMEVIRLSGYIDAEKVAIAKRYLIPRSLEKAGLPKGSVKYDTGALVAIADGYAREAGLRNFEKALDRIHRKVARSSLSKDVKLPLSLKKDSLVEYLGKPVFLDDEMAEISKPGMATGLAWTQLGGAVLTIEAVANPGKEGFKLTGKLGEVMQESANIAYSYVRHISGHYGVAADYWEKNLIHLHVPAGATPKDGPSAGITLASALLSLATGKKLKKSLAMTGELSLVGRVLPIGGLKEKVIAARRNRIRRVIYPQGNERDLDEIPAARPRRPDVLSRVLHGRGDRADLLGLGQVLRLQDHGSLAQHREWPARDVEQGGRRVRAPGRRHRRSHRPSSPSSLRISSTVCSGGRAGPVHTRREQRLAECAESRSRRNRLSGTRSAAVPPPRAGKTRVSGPGQNRASRGGTGMSEILAIHDGVGDEPEEGLVLVPALHPAEAVLRIGAIPISPYMVSPGAIATPPPARMRTSAGKERGSAAASYHPRFLRPARAARKAAEQRRPGGRRQGRLLENGVPVGVHFPPPQEVAHGVDLRRGATADHLHHASPCSYIPMSRASTTLLSRSVFNFCRRAASSRLCCFSASTFAARLSFVAQFIPSYAARPESPKKKIAREARVKAANADGNESSHAFTTR